VALRPFYPREAVLPYDPPTLYPRLPHPNLTTEARNSGRAVEGLQTLLGLADYLGEIH